MVEFNYLFDQWAPIYDETVSNTEGEYHEVFENYSIILNEVSAEIVKRGFGKTLEIGVGTGNLTSYLKNKGIQVTGVEPSEKMLQIARNKIPDVQIYNGHFLSIPSNEKFDNIVSSYAFHHLKYYEKAKAINYLDGFLNSKGKIIIADTMFESIEYKKQLFKHVEDSKAYNLLNDLNSEYYEYLEDILTLFKNINYSCTSRKLNKYVWLIVAEKID